MGKTANLVFEDRFNGTLSGWTLDQTGGTVTIVTQDNSTKMKLDATDGANAVSAILAITEPASPWWLELDGFNSTGDTFIAELLDSGDNVITSYQRGDTVDQIDFDTDNAAVSSVATDDNEYRQAVFYIDNSANTITCNTARISPAATESFAPQEVIGAAKSYTGATITQLRIRTIAEVATLYVDEVRYGTSDVFITGDSIMDGKTIWSAHPEYIAGRLNATENETSSPNYVMAGMFGSNSTHMVNNRAFGGAIAENINDSIQAMVIDQGANKVILGIGHNDVVTPTALADFKTEFNGIITKIQTAVTGQNIIVANVMPGIDINSAAEISLRGIINLWVEHRCHEEGMVYVGIDEIMTSQLDFNAVHPDYIGGDGIHLVAEGTVVMTRAVEGGVLTPDHDGGNRLWDDIGGADNERLYNNGFESGAGVGGTIPVFMKHYREQGFA